MHFQSLFIKSISCYDLWRYKEQYDRNIHFLSRYRYKNRIEEVHVEVSFREFIDSIEMLQFILDSFQNVRDFYLQIVDREWECKFDLLIPEYVRFTCHPQSKIVSLSISSQYDIPKIVDMFSSLKTIKILNVECIDGKLPNVPWELEQFSHCSTPGCFYDKLDNEVFNENISKFLEGQKDTLKVLQLYFNYSYECSDVVITKLLNLQSLVMDFPTSSNFVASTPNKTLKELAFLMLEETHLDKLRELLIHYNHIETLYIGMNLYEKIDPEIIMESFTLENLKSLCVSGIGKFFFNAATMPNLNRLDIVRSLEFKRFDLNFPLRTVKNLTHLGIEQVTSIEKLLEMLKMCTALNYLNVDMNLSENYSESVIFDICQAVPSLKHLKVGRKYFKPIVSIPIIIEYCRRNFRVSLTVTRHFIPVTKVPFAFGDNSISRFYTINGQKIDQDYGFTPCTCRMKDFVFGSDPNARCHFH